MWNESLLNKTHLYKQKGKTEQHTLCWADSATVNCDGIDGKQIIRNTVQAGRIPEQCSEIREVLAGNLTTIHC